MINGIDNASDVTPENIAKRIKDIEREIKNLDFNEIGAYGKRDSLARERYCLSEKLTYLENPDLDPDPDPDPDLDLDDLDEDYIDDLGLDDLFPYEKPPVKVVEQAKPTGGEFSSNCLEGVSSELSSNLTRLILSVMPVFKSCNKALKLAASFKAFRVASSRFSVFKLRTIS